MDAWLKILRDGSVEVGTEAAIKRGEVSWSRGRQDIVETSIYWGDKFLTLICLEKNGCLASWEQKDHYMASLQKGKSVRFERELTCTTNGYSSLNIVTLGDGRGILVILSDSGIKPIPPSVKKISTRLDLSGSFGYKFVE